MHTVSVAAGQLATGVWRDIDSWVGVRSVGLALRLNIALYAWQGRSRRHRVPHAMVGSIKPQGIRKTLCVY